MQCKSRRALWRVVQIKWYVFTSYISEEEKTKMLNSLSQPIYSRKYPSINYLHNFFFKIRLKLTICLIVVELLHNVVVLLQLIEHCPHSQIFPLCHWNMTLPISEIHQLSYTGILFSSISDDLILSMYHYSGKKGIIAYVNRNVCLLLKDGHYNVVNICIVLYQRIKNFQSINQ